MKVIADAKSVTYYQHRAIEEIMAGNFKTATSILAIAQAYDPPYAT